MFLHTRDNDIYLIIYQTMNSLLPRFRSRFGHIPYWKSPNSLKENIYEPNQRNQTKFQHLQNSSLPRFEDKLLNSEFRLITGLYWTQKRYQKQYPRFHRDVQMPDFDFYRKKQFIDVSKTTWGEGDEKPGLVYVAGFFSMLCGAYGFKSHLTHYVTYMGPAADVLALASIEVDLGKIEPGVCVSIKWRGKPLFVKHRTPADIDFESQTPITSLRDPETPEQRAKKPEWLIVVGICTHLGCVPVPNSGDYPGGFYCPCHGSHYDNIGRARKGPAPLNLEVPPYKFLTDTLVIVG